MGLDDLVDQINVREGTPVGVRREYIHAFVCSSCGVERHFTDLLSPAEAEFLITVAAAWRMVKPEKSTATIYTCLSCRRKEPGWLAMSPAFVALAQRRRERKGRRS